MRAGRFELCAAEKFVYFYINMQVCLCKGAHIGVSKLRRKNGVDWHRFCSAYLLHVFTVYSECMSA
jgi:hypothetical protein